MKKIIAAAGITLALGFTVQTAQASEPSSTPCSGTIDAHQGNCKVVAYKYKDGFVPTGAFDPASFPQTLFSTNGSLPNCGWQEDLVQGEANVPSTLTESNYFDSHGWLVDSRQSPEGTPACSTVVTTTTVPEHQTTIPWASTTTTPSSLIPPIVVEAPPAEAVPVQPKFTG